MWNIQGRSQGGDMRVKTPPPPIGPNFLVIFTKILMKRHFGAYMGCFDTLKPPIFGNFWPQNPILMPLLATPLETYVPWQHHLTELTKIFFLIDFLVYICSAERWTTWRQTYSVNLWSKLQTAKQITCCRIMNLFIATWEVPYGEAWLSW